MCQNGTHEENRCAPAPTGFTVGGGRREGQSTAHVIKTWTTVAGMEQLASKGLAVSTLTHPGPQGLPLTPSLAVQQPLCSVLAVFPPPRPGPSPTGSAVLRGACVRHLHSSEQVAVAAVRIMDQAASSDRIWLLLGAQKNCQAGPLCGQKRSQEDVWPSP